MFKGFSLAYDSAWLHWILLSLLVLVISLLARRYFARFVAAITKRVLPTYSQVLVRLVKRTNIILLLIISAKITAQFFVLPKDLSRFLDSALVVALIIQSGLWASVLADQWFLQYAEKKQAKDPSSLTAFGLLSFATRMLIWIVVALVTLENLGINISALVAGLGIGGVAVALAVQNILGDLLGSLSIILDKPFVVGDTIVIGDITGTVERIGVKTTHLRALSGEQIIMTNSDLLSSRIRNFKRMYERRIAFTVGVSYETAPESLEAIPQMIREIIESQTPIRFDRAHLRTLGDGVIIFEIVYFILSSDFQIYMNVQQAVNIELLKRFKEAKIEFAALRMRSCAKSMPAAQM
jgi:small-conductance mechanosensitive channel